MNERIKELRKCLNLNQTEFGQKIGVKQSAVTGYESGTRTPMNPVIEAICRVYGVNRAWLLYGSGEMFASKTEQIALFMGDLLNEDDSSFKKRFIEALAGLPADKWDEIEKFVNNLVSKQG